MTYFFKSIVVFIACTMLSGCYVMLGTGDTYDWHGSYYQELYFNRGSVSELELAQELQEIADDADPKEPHELPPGFWAGLGLAWYRAGDIEKAVIYLKKEAEIWPEGKVAALALVKTLEEEQAVVSLDDKKVVSTEFLESRHD